MGKNELEDILARGAWEVHNEYSSTEDMTDALKAMFDGRAAADILSILRACGVEMSG